MQKEKPSQTAVVKEIQGKVSELFHCNEKDSKRIQPRKKEEAIKMI
jgi:hypothetical protein